MAESQCMPGMSRRIGISATLIALSAVIFVEWSAGVRPDPYRAPDPMAFGSDSGASGAICSFVPGVKSD